MESNLVPAGGAVEFALGEGDRVQAEVQVQPPAYLSPNWAFLQLIGASGLKEDRECCQLGVNGLDRWTPPAEAAHR